MLPVVEPAVGVGVGAGPTVPVRDVPRPAKSPVVTVLNENPPAASGVSWSVMVAVSPGLNAPRAQL